MPPCNILKNIIRKILFHIQQSKREEEVKAAHDQAMFGTPAFPAPEILETEKEEESNLSTKVNGQPLISEKVFIGSLYICVNFSIIDFWH